MLDPTSLNFRPGDYSKALDACGSFADIRILLEELPKDLTKCALEALDGASDEDWEEFQRGLKAQRSGDGEEEQAWIERWAEILIPGPILMITMYCVEFGIPFSATYQQLQRVNPPQWQAIVAGERVSSE